MIGVASVLGITACGSVGAVDPDAASIDGEALDPTVRVTAYSDNDGEAGVPNTAAFAVFLDPAGVELGKGPVDADGRASAAMPDGGSVYVYRAFDQTLTLTGFMRVEPGDELHAGLPPELTTAGAPSVMTLTFSDFDNAHTIHTPCEIQTAPAGASATLHFRDDCVSGATFPLVVSRTLNGGEFASQGDALYQAGGTIAAPTSYSGLQPYSLTVMGVPGGLGAATLSHATLTRAGTVHYAETAVASPAAGTLARSLDGVSAANVLVEDRILMCSGTPGAEVEVTRRRTGSTASGGIELGELPPVAAVPTTTATEVSWSQVGSGHADAVLAQWQMGWELGAGLGVGQLVMVLIMPAPDAPGPHSIARPPFPSEFASYAPPENATFTYLGTNLYYVDNSFTDGYAQAKDYPDVQQYGYYKLADVARGTDMVQKKSHASNFGSACSPP